VQALANEYANVGFVYREAEHELLMRAARADPTALDSVISALIGCFNAGRIHPYYEVSAIRCLNDFAKVSEHLREKMASTISPKLLDFYCSDSASPQLREAAKELSETLKVGRPIHYFDLCRRILINEGSIFIIGAGFSYDSYAPLLQETEGIACSTLYDLGESNPRGLYRTNERRAWQAISRDWQVFQRRMAFLLGPKVPSEQHLILAELFHDRHIIHIISFNWDDLVEKAYKTRYDNDIPKVAGEGLRSDHALWKLHGDIANPDERWVLPFEEGRVFKTLEEVALETVLPTFIVGYREQESAVCERLIPVLEKRGGVSRIRPDLANNPPESFADNAQKAMVKIKAGIESARRSACSA
jgi:hypothetical protein